MTEHVTAWAPLEEVIPADVLKADVRTWAKRIGVKPRTVTVHRSSHEAQVGKLYNQGEPDVQFGLAGPAGRLPCQGHSGGTAASEGVEPREAVQGATEESLGGDRKRGSEWWWGRERRVELDCSQV